MIPVDTLDILKSFDEQDKMHICSLVAIVQFLELINFFIIYHWLNNIKKDIKTELESKAPSKPKEPDLKYAIGGMT